MNRLLFHVKWLLRTLMLVAQSLILSADPNEAPMSCPVIAGPAVSCVNQLETYMTAPVSGYSYAWNVSAGGTLSTATGPSTLVNWNVAGAQFVVLVTTDPGGAVMNCTLNVTVHPRPSPSILTDFISDCPDKKHEQGFVVPQEREECWVVCEYTVVNYWTTNVPGNTYNWVIVGGTPVTGTGSSISVTWGAAGSGTVILTETSPGGCSETVEQCVKIVESPKAFFLFNGQDPTAGPLKICLGQTVYFADQSVGAAYWLWNFGDGVTSTLQNPSHPYDVAGTYYGTLTVKNECGCTDVLPFEIIVTNLASPEIGCISTVCLKDCAFYSVSNLGNCPGAVVTWTVQGGQIVNQPNSTSINVVWDDYDSFIKTNGYGLICAKVTGCPDLCDGEVCVRVPVIHQGLINGDQLVCVGDVVTYSVPVQPGINEPGNPPNGVNFDWFLSGGGAIVSTSPYSNTITVAWTSPGTYTVDMSPYENYLTNSDCKFDPDPITITVKPSFTISPDYVTICPGTSQTFNLSGTGSFNWTVTGPGGITGPFPGGNSYTVSPSAPGVYAVSAVSTSGVYCDVEPTAILKVLPAPPTPTGTLNGTVTVCPNTPYVYTLSNTPPPGTVYVWEITGGTLYGGAGQTVTAQWSGIPPMILTVKTKITQDPFCLSAPLNFTINNYTPPATFINTMLPATACVNETKSFWIAGLSNYTNLVWSVSPDVAGSVVSGQGTPNISVLFNTSAPPVVNIVCTATVCGIPITDQLAVNINQIPNYTINAPSSLCQYDATTLSVSPTTGIVAYNWNFGDGGTSTLAVPPHSWSTATSFPITAQLSLNICGNPTVVVASTIVIDPVPVAFVTASNGYVICPPTVTSTTLTAASQTACTYQWVGGPSGPLYTVTTPGVYTVIATDPTTGCTSSVVTEVVGCGNCTNPCVSATPPWTFTPTENCDTYTFTPTITGATFSSWDFGDGTFSGVAGTVTHTYAHPGYYQVRLTTIDPVNGCIMRVLQTITVKFKGGFSVNYSCASGTMQTILTDLSEYLPGVVATPTWYDGIIPIGSGSVFTTTLTGTHTISLSVTIGAQTCYSPPQTINVPAMPVAMFTHNAPKCEGVPVQFSNGSTGSFIGYTWAFGDLATSGVFNPDRTYLAPPGTYTVTLTVNSSWGCTSTSTSTLTIYQSGAPPTLSIAPAPTVCEGTPMTITATPGYTYAWFNSVAPAITLGTANPFGPVISGTYGLNATDANGCPYNVMAAPVVFLPPPYVQIVGKIDYCPGENISLSADIGSPGYTYAWTSSTPVGSPSFSGPNISHTGSVPGVYTYTVVITHTASGCTNSGTLSVVVHPGVTGLTITSSANCEPATLTAFGVGAVAYNWNTGDNTAAINVVQHGFYSVVASTVWGCTAGAEYNLEGRPDLSNVMTGCYEYCEPVEWQAVNCSGCTYQWYLNGAALPGETNPTINIATSGSYTVVVSSGPGCETESDPIDISIASNPDLCHKCDVDTKEATFECVGIDPATGFPIYAFTIFVTNNGGALSGLTATSSFGSVVIDNPVGGFIPGGGAVTAVSGHLIWDGSNMNGCFYFTGLLLEDCQVIDKCEFKWCGELPKCCDEKCELRVVESRVVCIGFGFYNVTLSIVNNGCTLFNAFVKTDQGIYPITPSTLPGSAASIVNVILPLQPGSQGISVCGYQFNGERCCVETKLEVPQCEDPHCVMDIKTIGITCLGRNTAGHYVYHFNLDVYGAPAGSSFLVIPNGTGLVSGVSYSCSPGVCNVQGNFESYSATDVVCFTILATTSTSPPEVCWGEKCIELPPCPSAKPSEGRNEKQVNKTVAINVSGFTLAPNPAFNEVTVLPADQSVKAVQIMVTDMVGQNKMTVYPTGTSQTLDIHQLPAGIYNVTVTDANGIAVSKKLVVLR